ncbi:MAG TPA: hypothetical protein VGX03_25485, partial [Candidatus Binatia bacterium]|nr:hypothetical protein [Candidatus Binatia bacterium]
LEITFGAKIEGLRKEAYLDILKNIPNELWSDGVVKLAQTARFFPSAAEIGEACIPGEAVRDEKDPWTGRWIKVKVPWPERLVRLLTPALPGPQNTPPEEQPPQVTKEQWQRLRDTISLIMNNPGIAQALLTEAPDARAIRQAHDQLEQLDRQTYDMLSLEDKVRWQIRKRGGPRPLQREWTHADMEARRAFIHCQFLYVSRREQAERTGEPFNEPRPVWEELGREDKAA